MKPTTTTMRNKNRNRQSSIIPLHAPFIGHFIQNHCCVNVSIYPFLCITVERATAKKARPTNLVRNRTFIMTLWKKPWIKPWLPLRPIRPIPSPTMNCISKVRCPIPTNICHHCHHYYFWMNSMRQHRHHRNVHHSGYINPYSILYQNRWWIRTQTWWST